MNMNDQNIFLNYFSYLLVMIELCPESFPESSKRCLRKAFVVALFECPPILSSVGFLWSLTFSDVVPEMLDFYCKYGQNITHV